MAPGETRSEVAVSADITTVSAPPIGIDKKAKGSAPDSFLSRLQPGIAFGGTMPPNTGKVVGA